jgi:hypothetical protein
MPEKLSVTGVAERLVSAMKAIQFTPVAGRPLKLIRKPNEETEIFLYPGVRRRGRGIRIDPIIGVENVTLRERLLAVDANHWQGHTRVCHAYLGLLDSWGEIHLNASSELNGAVERVVKSVLEVGLPRMREFDSLEKVKIFLKDPWAPTVSQPRTAVLFEKEKLSVLQDH